MSTGLQERTHTGQNTAVGRVLPHDVVAERALLGACILDGGQETLSRCIEEKLVADSFFKLSHQCVFKALLALYDTGTPIDEITLGNQLQKQGDFDKVEGHAGINTLTQWIETTGHAPYYLQIVKDKYLLRRLIRTASKTVEECYTQQNSLEHFLESVEQEFFKISEDRVSDTAQHIKDSVDQVVGLVYQLIEQKKPNHGVLSGFQDLDALTFGFHPQEMVILAARPSVGKTAFAMNIAQNAVAPPGGRSKPIPTLVFSLEMNTESLAMRMLCSHARLNMKRMRDGFMNNQEKADILRSAKALKEAPLWIDDSGGLNILELRAKARRFKSRMELGLIIVDYLQLVSGTDNRVAREQQISEISRSLKAMAKELNVPVIVLSQLNRDSEREKREPRLSDLRESGSIEQDADVVFLLHRLSKPDSAEDSAAENTVDRIDLVLAKQRNGPTGKVQLAFNRQYTRFENLSKSDAHA